MKRGDDALLCAMKALRREKSWLIGCAAMALYGAICAVLFCVVLPVVKLGEWFVEFLGLVDGAFKKRWY